MMNEIDGSLNILLLFLCICMLFQAEERIISIHIFLCQELSIDDV